MTETELVKPSVNMAEVVRGLIERIKSRAGGEAAAQAATGKSLTEIEVLDPHDAANLSTFKSAWKAVSFEALPASFAELCEAMQAKGGDCQKKILAHVRSVTGRPSLMLHALSSDAKMDSTVKTALYAQCLQAVWSGDYSKLQGQLAQGDRRVDPLPERVDPLEMAGEGTNIPQPPEQSAVPPRVVQVQSASDPTDELSAAQELIRILRSGRRESGLDEGRVRAIANECISKATPEVSESEVLAILKKGLSNGHYPTERTQELINEALKGFAKRIDLFDVKSDTVSSIDGLAHWQLPQLICWVNANVPLWVHGQAGGGKTHLARQIAAALELTPTVISINPTITVGKLLGYRNLLNGEFVEGCLYKPFRDGGLAWLDEIDTGDPGIIAAVNALIANGHYLFPNGETLVRHPKFRVACGANTKGCGAVAGYTARNRLDAATLDRFAIIELGYDDALEYALATGEVKAGAKEWKQSAPATAEAVKAWVTYTQKTRAMVGNSVLISPRCSVLGAQALRAGIPPAEVAEALLFKLTTSDTKQSIERSLGVFGKEE